MADDPVQMMTLFKLMINEMEASNFHLILVARVIGHLSFIYLSCYELFYFKVMEVKPFKHYLFNIFCLFFLVQAYVQVKQLLPGLLVP